MQDYDVDIRVWVKCHIYIENIILVLHNHIVSIKIFSVCAYL